jgi:hypothetical protein
LLRVRGCDMGMYGLRLTQHLNQHYRHLAWFAEMLDISMVAADIAIQSVRPSDMGDAVSRIFNRLGFALMLQGRFAEVSPLYGQCITELFVQPHQLRRQVNFLCDQGIAYRLTGEFDLSEEALLQALRAHFQPGGNDSYSMELQAGRLIRLYVAKARIIGPTYSDFDVAMLYENLRSRLRNETTADRQAARDVLQEAHQQPTRQDFHTLIRRIKWKDASMIAFRERLEKLGATTSETMSWDLLNHMQILRWTPNSFFSATILSALRVPSKAACWNALVLKCITALESAKRRIAGFIRHLASALLLI